MICRVCTRNRRPRTLLFAFAQTVSLDDFRYCLFTLLLFALFSPLHLNFWCSCLVAIANAYLCGMDKDFIMVIQKVYVVD